MFPIFRDRDGSAKGAAIEPIDRLKVTTLVDGQHVFEANPESPRVILPKSVHRAPPGDSNRGHPVPPQRVQIFCVSDPDRPVVGSQRGPDEARRNPLTRRERHDGALAETVQPFRRRQPKIAFAILKKAAHGVARKAVFAAEMIHSLAAHSVDTLVRRSHPERPIAIDEQGCDVRCVDSSKFGPLRPTVHDSEHAEAFPWNGCPHGTVNGRGNAGH